MRSASSHPPGLFITATDTGVGKTTVACGIARTLHAQGHAVGVYKPIATGGVRHGGRLIAEDAQLLAQAAATPAPLERVCPVVLEEPLAPTVAARRAGLTIGWSALVAGARWWLTRCDVLLVEGVGGLLCPLAPGRTVADLAVELQFPLIIVARLGLGTLNHALLTVEAARRRHLRVAAVVLNDSHAESATLAAQTNPQELPRWLDAVPLFTFPHEPATGLPTLETYQKINWLELAAGGRELLTSSGAST